MNTTRKTITKKEQEDFLNVLEQRFNKNKHRHEGLKWEFILSKLIHDSDKLWSLFEMEKTGGEPDVVVLNHSPKDYFYIDCSKESPTGRRSLCYDKAAFNSRKENKPLNNAMDIAQEMGISLLNEEEYRALQSIEEFDLKTSSWIQTPDAIRKLKGALFGDRRYNHVFIYHNGAESYYAARGFRGLIKI
jgi:hypothetical protein